MPIKTKFREPVVGRTMPPLKFTIHRTGHRGAQAFEVCVRKFQGKAAGLREGNWDRCGLGRNPRHALANAMTKFAKALKKRKGAFAGLAR